MNGNAEAILAGRWRYLMVAGIKTASVILWIVLVQTAENGSSTAECHVEELADSHRKNEIPVERVFNKNRQQ